MNGTHTAKKKRSKGKPHLYLYDTGLVYEWPNHKGTDDECEEFCESWTARNIEGK